MKDTLGKISSHRLYLDLIYFYAAEIFGYSQRRGHPKYSLGVCSWWVHIIAIGEVWGFP